MQTAEEILAAIQLAETLLTNASVAFAKIKADLSETDLAKIQAAVASSGASLDAARAQLDADAA